MVAAAVKEEVSDVEADSDDNDGEFDWDYILPQEQEEPQSEPQKPQPGPEPMGRTAAQHRIPDQSQDKARRLLSAPAPAGGKRPVTSRQEG